MGMGKYPLAGKRGCERGKFSPSPRPHPRSGIFFCPYPLPHWGREIFPNVGRGPDGDRDSLPHCHSYSWLCVDSKMAVLNNMIS